MYGLAHRGDPGRHDAALPLLRALVLALAALALLMGLGLCSTAAMAHPSDSPAVTADAAHPCPPADGDPAKHAAALCGGVGCLHLAHLPQLFVLAAAPRAGWPPPAPAARPGRGADALFRPPRPSAPA